MKQFKITVNGKTYDVAVEESNGVASAPAAAPAGAEAIKAPMPGNIMDVRVSAGQTVKKGDVLVILEAMKMENEIMAPRDGKVAQVACTKGATVNTGDALVVLE